MAASLASSALTLGASDAEPKPGPPAMRKGWPADAFQIAIVGQSGRRFDQTHHGHAGIRRRREHGMGFRIEAGAGPVGAAAQIGDVDHRAGITDLADDRRARTSGPSCNGP